MVIFRTTNLSDCIEKTVNLASFPSDLDGKSCFIFSEDKITLSVELKLASVMGNGYFNKKVYSFRNYVLDKGDYRILTKEECAIIIRKLIMDGDSDYSCFTNIKNSPKFSSVLFDIISQLESARIDSNMLGKLIKDEENNLPKGLVCKLRDITKVYSLYENYLKEKGYYDPVSYLSILPSKIQKDSRLKNSVIIFSGFNNLTQHRIQAIKELSNLSSEVYHVVVSGDDSHVYTNDTEEKLKNNFKIEEIKPQPSSLNYEANLMKEYLYDTRCFSSSFKKHKTDKIEVYEAWDINEEVEELCKGIIEETNRGRRYKNIAIACGDLGLYRSKIKDVFNKNGIPYYMDEPNLLSYHPLANLVCSLIDLVRLGLDQNSYLKLLRNPLFIAQDEIVDKYSSYIKRNGIARKLFLDKIDEPALEMLRFRVENIIEYIDKDDTVDVTCENLKKVFEYLDCKKQINELGNKLNEINELVYEDFNSRAYDSIIEILDFMASIMKGNKISLSEFKNLFIAGCNEKEVNGIPMYSDAIYIGECLDVKMKTADCLFAIGINGDVPFVQSDTSILTDGDLGKLKNYQMMIEPTVNLVNLRERENVCLTLMAFRDKLRISYTLSSSGGRKSDIVNYILHIFDISPKRFDLEKNKYISKQFILKELIKLQKDKDVNKDKAIQYNTIFAAICNCGDQEFINEVESLINRKESGIGDGGEKYFKDDTISPTTIESYFKCPYSAFASVLLSLKDDDNGSFRINEIGTIIHEVLRGYYDQIENISSLLESENLAVSLLNNALDSQNYVIYKNNVTYGFTRGMLEEEVKKICQDMFEYNQRTKFKKYCLESKIGSGNNVNKVPFEVMGKEVLLNGFVDRVDKYNDYIRIVDYKTGSIHDSDEEFYTGQALQLYLYMSAFLVEDIKPAGVYYYKINDNFKENEDVTFNGKTVNSEEILEATDTGEELNSDFGIKNGRNGYSNTIDSLQMNNRIEYAKAIARVGIEEMSHGNIDPSPYERKCIYCKYKGLCGFTKGVNRERKELVRNFEKDVNIKSSSKVEEVGEDVGLSEEKV